MRKIIFILIPLFIHLPAYGQDSTGKQPSIQVKPVGAIPVYRKDNSETSPDIIEKIVQAFYKDVKYIEKFGIIHVHVRNKEEDRIGLSEKDLTNYLKLRFKNNFANIPYEEAPLVISMEGERKTGMLWCGVWVVGDEYPVAYHVECRLGTLLQPRILEDATLGVGSKNNVPDSVRQAIDRMVTKFAISFFKYRGGM